MRLVVTCPATEPVTSVSLGGSRFTWPKGVTSHPCPCRVIGPSAASPCPCTWTFQPTGAMLSLDPTKEQQGWQIDVSPVLARGDPHWNKTCDGMRVTFSASFQSGLAIVAFPMPPHRSDGRCFVTKTFEVGAPTAAPSGTGAQTTTTGGSSCSCGVVRSVAGVREGECGAITVTRVGFEPSQGVWQDDPGAFPQTGDRFPETGAERTAQVPLVAGRPTLLFGALPAGAKTEDEKARQTLTLEGTTTIQTNKPPGKLSLLLTLAAPNTTDRTRLVDVTKIDGAGASFLVPDCRPASTTPKKFTLGVNAPKGIGIEGTTPFVLEQPGHFTITAQARRGDEDVPGLRGTIQGTVVKTELPPITFIAAAVKGRSGSSEQKVLTTYQNDARGFVEPVFQGLASVLPVALPPKVSYVPPPETFKSGFFDDPKQNADTTRMEQFKSAWEAAGEVPPDDQFLNDEVSFLHWLATLPADARPPAHGWLVVIVPAPTMVWLGLALDGKAAYGAAIDDHVVVINGNVAANSMTVAHELLHTLPRWLWGPKNGINRECGQIADITDGPDLHNNAHAEANGVRIGSGGLIAFMERKKTLMGAPFDPTNGGTNDTTVEKTVWIDQCSYAHALRALETR